MRNTETAYDDIGLITSMAILVISLLMIIFVVDGKGKVRRIGIPKIFKKINKRKEHN